ncbi:hypothetical protein PsYK624_085840 [Phanerochaete sordida]|uniref:Uncharacterized protein n=1 Tax=Phanerochaete sordida TaxID=48140 RepID=A0A9P3GER9_9APHY|nr:hypothetical protein PsYK624_085840 [Phanerochaete sordida]
MQFTLTTALLAVAAALGSAAATPVEIKARVGNSTDAAQAGLFVCTDAGFSGNCENVGFGDAQCVVFPGAFQNDISAIGPPTGWVCDAYTDFSCNGDGLGDITFPGISDLGDGNTNYNDRLNSFICFST